MSVLADGVAAHDWSITGAGICGKPGRSMATLTWQRHICTSAAVADRGPARKNGILNLCGGERDHDVSILITVGGGGLYCCAVAGMNGVGPAPEKWANRPVEGCALEGLVQPCAKLRTLLKPPPLVRWVQGDFSALRAEPAAPCAVHENNCTPAHPSSVHMGVIHGRRAHGHGCIAAIVDPTRREEFPLTNLYLVSKFTKTGWHYGKSDLTAFLAKQKQAKAVRVRPPLSRLRHADGL